MSNPPPCPPCGKFSGTFSLTANTIDISKTKAAIHKAVTDALATQGFHPEVTVEYSD